MISKLNLASKPFRNRTTPYLLSLIVFALACGTAIVFFAQLNENQRLIEVADNQILEMETELGVLRQRGELVQQQLTPTQRELLVASHKLVANKTFGWSRLFYDIESVIPGGVSASRISVANVYRDGDRVNAELDLTVLSRDYQSVMAMISAMNNSGVFRAELRSQSRQESQRQVFTEYTLRLIYMPPYGVNPSANEIARADEGGVN